MEELVSRLATHVNIDVSHNRFSQAHHGMSSCHGCHGTSWYELMATTAVMAVNAWEPRYGKRWIDQDSKINCEIRQGQRHAIADAAVQYGCNISPLVLFQDCHGFSKLCLAGTCKSLDGQFAADSRNNKMPSWKQDWLRCMVECLDSLMPFESRSQSVVFPTGWKRVLSSSLLSSVDILWYFSPPQFPL